MSASNADSPQVDTSSGDKTLVVQLKEFAFEAQCVQVVAPSADAPTSALYLGLSHSGRLYAATRSANRLLASNVNSFTIASGFLIYTTTAHVAHFAPLDALSSLLTESGETVSLPEWETRRVERGSRIVVAVPSNMSLVLQMPRGNLETINPRPLVMKIVSQDIDRFVLYPYR